VRPLTVRDAHMNAVDELLDSRNQLTRALLGGRAAQGPPASPNPVTPSRGSRKPCRPETETNANMKLARALNPRATHGNTLVMRRSLDGDEDQGDEVPSCAGTGDVPARPVNAGTSRSLPCSPKHRLTCGPAGRPAAKPDLPSWSYATGQGILAKRSSARTLAPGAEGLPRRNRPLPWPPRPSVPPGRRRSARARER
jgi:hypothetical protein